MRWMIFLIGSLLLAQYRLEGEQIEPPKKTHAKATIIVTPAYLRHTAIGKWDTLQAELHFLFLPRAVYWLDPRTGVAYDITFSHTDTLLYYIELSGEAAHAGRMGKLVRFHFFGKKMEVLWDESVPFDWSSWLQYLPSEGLGTPGRYFRRGIPLYWRLLDEKGQLLSEFRHLKVEPYEPKASDAQVPYPIKKLGE